jgi:hypothetical protein
MHTDNVRYWHEADIERGPSHTNLSRYDAVS